MAKQSSGLPQAVEQALAQALGSIQRQLKEVQGSYKEVERALKSARGGGPERFARLLPPLMQMQAAGSALAASIESVLRFVGSSAQWSGAPAAAAGAAMVSPVEEVAAEEETSEKAGPALEAEPAAAVEEAAPEEVVALPKEPAVVQEAPPAVAEEPAAKVEEPVPAEPEVAAPAAAVAIDSLPEDLQALHKKAKRFAKVTVQELFMYKKDEVIKGREHKDLYDRFKEEIDKSKALYDKRFEKIAAHNADYLYDELVRVLAEKDPSALGNYPYTPALQR
ncbi:MAG: hypothetical protein IH847_10305 [Acidobacteria bacterium]|nr:hypothetical protein [Acidobacteriota bacterium]